MHKPSILFLNRVYPSSCGGKGRGATGRVLRDLARGFARDGWDVTVVTSGPKAIVEQDGDVRVIRVKGAEKPSGFGYLRVWLKMLLKGLFLPRTDLVVSMTDPPLLAVIGDLICGFKGNKHMHWCQDVYPELFPALGVKFPRFLIRGMKRRVRGAMERADKVVVIGRCMARSLGYAGLEAGKMAVIPNWPDMELGNAAGTGRAKNDFDKTPLHAVDASDKVNKDAVKHYRTPKEQTRTEPKFRVLYAGNIGLAHPVETILDAAEILGEKYPEIEFLFVGDGKRYDALAEERGKRHLDNIRLLPFQPANRLRSLMESGDLHIVSMDDAAEGLLVPSKIYAALAVGRPCVFVGPKGCEVSIVLEEFKAGDVIRQGAVQALVECVLEYRLDADKWFSAHNGAVAAGGVFVPKDAMKAWIERARGVLEDVQDVAVEHGDVVSGGAADEDIAA